MIDQEFYTAVAATDFCEQYYALCERFHVRDGATPEISAIEMGRLLTELNQKPHRDARDKSYSFDKQLHFGLLHIGFVIQKKALVEFWYCLEQANRRIGSNFAVIAYEATKVSQRRIPSPPYPRPEFHTIDELREILTKCFDLARNLEAIFDCIC